MMVDFPRTDEGFMRAYEEAKWLAREHPNRTYALFVDSAYKNRYTVCMAVLVSKEKVEEDTIAHIVNADGEMTELFQN